MPEFYETRAGRLYLEKTLPDLVRAILRLADVVERLETTIRQKDAKESVEPRNSEM